MDVLLVLTTFPDKEKARQIGTALIEKQLAACVNLLPHAESIYQWEGRVCREEEVVGLFKLPKKGYSAFEAELLRMHPYDVAEVIALSPETGLQAYLDWVCGPMG